jgi:hypothetical protein
MNEVTRERSGRPRDRVAILNTNPHHRRRRVSTRLNSNSAMSQADESRFALELELLQAMYPDQIDYNAKSRDLKFAEQSALLHLRLPEQYPEAGLPDVVAARDAAKNDLRDRTKAAVRDAGLAAGEEALDAIIACFQRIVEETDRTRDSQTGIGSTSATCSPASEASKTVIIWLHHLLALSKRKLALSPASISGVTKPGYPGVMLFSGPASAVTDHVKTLKAENWQAFQVRYEGDELWVFDHGSGIKEAETMAEVVKAVEAGNNGAKQKQELLQAVGIK